MSEPTQPGQVTKAPENTEPTPTGALGALGLTPKVDPVATPVTPSKSVTNVPPVTPETTPPVTSPAEKKPSETPPVETPSETSPATPAVIPAPEFTSDQRAWVDGYIAQQNEAIKAETAKQVAIETEARLTAEFNARETASNEFLKDPYGFLAKHAPALTIDKFDPKTYVKDKLREKYGDSAKAFNPAEQYDPESPSYDIGADMRQWETEAREIEKQPKNILDEEQKQQQANLEQTVKTIQTKYGMDDTTFRQKIWDKIGNMSDSNKLELIADKLMAEDGQAAITKNITDQNLTRIPPSPTSLGGNLPPAGTEKTSQETFKELFGAKRQRVSVAGLV